MRGLPWQATRDEIAEFFKPLEAESIHIVRDIMGRPSGECFAIFVTPEEQSRACSPEYHKKFMRARYIELYRTTPQNFAQRMGIPLAKDLDSDGSEDDEDETLNYVIQMQGLPSPCTEEYIKRFFKKAGLTPSAIYTQPNGPVSFIEFRVMKDLRQALTLDKSNIGGDRYAELWKAPREHMVATMRLNWSVRQRPETPPIFYPYDFRGLSTSSYGRRSPAHPSITLHPVQPMPTHISGQQLFMSPTMGPQTVVPAPITQWNYNPPAGSIVPSTLWSPATFGQPDNASVISGPIYAPGPPPPTPPAPTPPIHQGSFTYTSLPPPRAQNQGPGQPTQG